MSQYYHTVPNDSLASILDSNYFRYSRNAQLLIARNILYLNPELCIKIMPPQFWGKLGALSRYSLYDILQKPFGKLSKGIELPDTKEELFHVESSPDLFSIDSGAYGNNQYRFENVFEETSEDKVAFIASEDLLSKKLQEEFMEYLKDAGGIVEKTAKKTIKTTFKMLLNDPEFVASLGVEKATIFTILNPTNAKKVFTENNIKLFFEKLNSKIQMKILNGERYITVYGNKDANGVLKILLEGTEKDASIIALGVGREAAKKILSIKGIPYITMVIVSSLDVKEYIFSDKETLDELFQNLAVDNSKALAGMIAGALGSELTALALIATGVTLPLYGVVGIAVIVGLMAAEIYEILDKQFHITNYIKKSVTKVHSTVSRKLTIMAEEQINSEIYKYNPTPSYGGSGPFSIPF